MNISFHVFSSSKAPDPDQRSLQSKSGFNVKVILSRVDWWPVEHRCSGPHDGGSDGLDLGIQDQVWHSPRGSAEQPREEFR